MRLDCLKEQISFAVVHCFWLFGYGTAERKKPTILRKSGPLVAPAKPFLVCLVKLSASASPLPTLKKKLLSETLSHTRYH